MFPNSHYVTTSDKMEHAITTIEEEMKQQVEYFKSQGKLIESSKNRRTY
ncbi:excinuclease ABC, B subunit [human gut metagenome]|uniref:Excinuclease ABC, B subunit n=1 Tax=human gut metagenome TaxID=408170 RepID=K1S7D1_9ZZZZ